MHRKNIIYVVVAIIAVLLLLDILFTRRNNRIIGKNKALQAEISNIKLYYDQIGKVIIHSLDLGLRGYAIVPDPKLSSPMNNAVNWKDSIISRVEQPLSHLGYDLTTFNILKDSVDAYIRYAFNLKELIEKDRNQEFAEIFRRDKGALLWWQYLKCEASISSFLNKINNEAQKEYEAAMFRNQVIQIVLFFICIPTLLFTALETNKNFKLYELLRVAVEEKNKILREQNSTLEQQVSLRTQELEAQNEEILSQSEELAAHRDTLALQNKQLHEAQKVIAEQNEEIHAKNRDLEIEVQERTHELENTNQELIKYNNQLERFAFFAAHNLRAPLARIQGLVNVMQVSKTESDKELMMQMLVISSHDLDEVIKDLNTILDITKYKNDIIEVNLLKCLERVRVTLAKEFDETKAIITTSFVENTSMIKAVPSYVESVLYQVLSNAIKFRHPDRPPYIEIQTISSAAFVCMAIKDNGLGIDLATNNTKLFGLYKRFHFHVEGKGLGLYLSKTQMDAMGGKITVESVQWQGSTFFLYFQR